MHFMKFLDLPFYNELQAKLAQLITNIQNSIQRMNPNKSFLKFGLLHTKNQPVALVYSFLLKV